MRKRAWHRRVSGVERPSSGAAATRAVGSVGIDWDPLLPGFPGVVAAGFEPFAAFLARDSARKLWREAMAAMRK